MAGSTTPPQGEAKKIKITDIAIRHMRKYRLPAQVEAFNADVLLKGQLVPIILALIDGVLVLADGHCRIEALIAAGETEVLGVIDPRITTEEHLLAFLIDTENRSDRNPLDLALRLEAYRAAKGLNQKELAAALRIAESKTSLLLGLTAYPEDVRKLFGEGKLNLVHHAAVAKLDPEKRADALRDGAARSVTGRGLKREVKPPKAKAPPRVLKMEVGGVSLRFPANLAVGKFQQDLDGVVAKVTERLKAVPKTALSMREVLAQ